MPDILPSSGSFKQITHKGRAMGNDENEMRSSADTQGTSGEIPGSVNVEKIVTRCPDCMGSGMEKPMPGLDNPKPCACDDGKVLTFVMASPIDGIRHVFQKMPDLALALCGHHVVVESLLANNGAPPCIGCFHVLSMLNKKNDGRHDMWSGDVPK